MLILGLIFLAFIGFACLDLIITFFKGLWEIIYYGSLNYYKYKHVDKPMRESGYLEKKKMEEAMIEAEKANWHKEQTLNKQNKIIQAGLSKVRELRIRYPYAEEELFQTFLKKFPVYSVPELNSLEEEIKQSHFNNEINRSLNPIPEKQYTLEDINGVEWLEENREDPVVVRIYKIDDVYLLYVKDIDSNNTKLFQSNDYLPMARVMVKIIETQRNLKAMKKNIVAEQIEALYNNIAGSSENFRRNRL